MDVHVTLCLSHRTAWCSPRFHVWFCLFFSKADTNWNILYRMCKLALALLILPYSFQIFSTMFLCSVNLFCLHNIYCWITDILGFDSETDSKLDLNIPKQSLIICCFCEDEVACIHNDLNMLLNFDGEFGILFNKWHFSWHSPFFPHFFKNISLFSPFKLAW